MQFFTKILFVIFFTTSLFASQKASVLVIHSYSQEYPWTKKQHNSFVSTLHKSNIDFDYHIEHLDTKRLKLTNEYQQKFLRYLKFKYADMHFAFIYVTDDNALKFIYEHKKELFKDKKQVPVFFSGVNDLDMRKVLPKESYTGIYETKEIKPNIKLIKQFSPQTREIWFIGDNSNTYNAIKKELEEQQKDFPKMNFHYISDGYISKIKEQLPNKKRSFVILTTIGNLKDNKDNTLMPKESINIISENKKLIILSMEDAYMTEGVIGGYLTSGLKQGEEAAKLVLSYFKNNSLEGISSLIKSPNIYMFNSKELINSRVILSEYIARNSTIIGKDITFIEKNKSILLDIFLILLFISAIAFIILYALQRRKYANQQNELNKLQNIDLKFQMQKQLTKNILNLGDISYWKLNVKNDKVFISDELTNILGIDIELYKDDPYFLHYFVNSDDKNILSENISYVKNSKKSIKFTHEIITSNKSVFHVKHIIFVQNDQKDEDLTIVGIIKFDKSQI